MSTRRSNIGAWAADAERAEEEEQEAAAAAAIAGGSGDAGSFDFPSLKEAVSTKPKKKKMSLMEFNNSAGSGGGGGGFAREQRGLTPDEMLRLPTGPKERSAEEMQYGRGFSNYGGGRSVPPPGRGLDRNDGDGSWGGGRRSYGDFDEERRGGPRSRVSDFDQPSRADEVDNWASLKKPVPAFDSGRQNRYGSLGGGGGSSGGNGDGGVGGSRADEVDNWTAGKKSLPVRSSTFGSGFRDSGPEPDRWTRGKRDTRDLRDSDRERPILVLDPPQGNGSVNEMEAVVKTNKPNPFGAARPREEVLAEKGLDWKKLDSEIESKRPISAHSSRPSSAQSSCSEGPAGLQVKPKVNPFGDAKPREVLLEEKGMDWKKIDLELDHRRFDRPETTEEKLLKEEIDNLKKELGKESEANSNKISSDEVDTTNKESMLLQKERELEILTRDLDNKIRFGQKAIEGPGSAIGRTTGFPDRPPSQSGSFEDSRSVDSADRPRSRGTGDMWARSNEGRGPLRSNEDRRPLRSNEDRRPFQGSRDRGWFQNSRDLDRSRSKERW
ncbi:hypothetical protein HN51_030924 [Arachis hypogaea]|uniref:Uncharacterized protein n=2 Tax=Arachis TaxID=3817 RepID=A0A445B978_ARAHY|nr:eukaryotic translation initiation factor 4B1 [Arachis hypogaea]QHO15502.1 Eukaryotic translation initiation factor [Arachis hypogaea]RYR35235.1 hypothetical protein Ahy_A10g050381 [Arachis hypogaea]